MCVTVANSPKRHAALSDKSLVFNCSLPEYGFDQKTKERWRLAHILHVNSEWRLKWKICTSKGRK